LIGEFGLTVREIEASGYPIAERIEVNVGTDSRLGAARSMGLGAAAFAEVLERRKPDILLALGDRFEMLSAVAAAFLFRVPIGHIHGGEVTEGAFDESMRHAITKLSHLHFVTAEEHARRVRQLGEEPWRITVCGSPALDLLRGAEFLDGREFRERFGLQGLPDPFVLATYHPETLGRPSPAEQMRAILAGLKRSGIGVLFTQSNADPGYRVVLELQKEYVASNPERAYFIPNLSNEGYYCAMKLAAAMVGNSSSGLIEAPSVGLPVINVGGRQAGRLRAENVIDVAADAEEIAHALEAVVRPEYRRSLRGLCNPYDQGGAADRIINILKETDLGDRLTRKRFADLPHCQEKGTP